MSREPSNEAPHAEVTRKVLAKLRKMSKAESLKTFVDAGIVTKGGKLTKPYRPSPEAQADR